jgi:hypothetical protein
MKTHSVKDGNKREYQGFTLLMLIRVKMQHREQTTCMILYSG